MSRYCSTCSGFVSAEIDDRSGNIICSECGTVLEEGSIVNEITFTETSGGRSFADGTFVDESTRHLRNIPGSYAESREVTLERASRRIKLLADQLRMSSSLADNAHRLFTLALQHNFTRGRKAMHVAAACLYIVCRMEKTPHMLLDFSEALQEDVFVIGHTFIQLTQTLKLTLPLVEPFLYVRRFAAKMEFGAKTNQVVQTSLKLISRMKRDWIQTGRRPAGLCAAALLIAARIHGFRRTQDEVVKVVRICTATLSKRLREFYKTPAIDMTPEEFENAPEDWGYECDPPAFQRAQKEKRMKKLIEKKKKKMKKLQEEYEEEEEEKPKKSKKRKKKKKKKSEEEEEEEKEEKISHLDEEKKEKTEKEEETTQTVIDITGEDASKAMDDINSLMETDEFQQLNKDINYSIDNSDKFLFEEQPDVEEVKVEEDDGRLDELDDEELDQFIVTNDEEIKLREKIWDNMYKPYLEEMERKRKEKEELEKQLGTSGEKKKRQRKRKRKEEPQVPAKSAAEAAASVLRSKTRKQAGLDDIEGLFGEKIEEEYNDEEQEEERPKGLLDEPFLKRQKMERVDETEEEDTNNQQDEWESSVELDVTKEFRFL